MIRLTEFTELITSYVENVKKINEVGEIFNTDMWEVPCIDYQNKLFEFILNQLFTKEGVSIISCWLWDLGVDMTKDNCILLFETVKQFRK